MTEHATHSKPALGQGTGASLVAEMAPLPGAGLRGPGQPVPPSAQHRAPLTPPPHPSQETKVRQQSSSDLGRGGGLQSPPQQAVAARHVFEGLAQRVNLLVEVCHLIPELSAAWVVTGPLLLLHSEGVVVSILLVEGRGHGYGRVARPQLGKVMQDLTPLQSLYGLLPGWRR